LQPANFTHFTGIVYETGSKYGVLSKLEHLPGNDWNACASAAEGIDNLKSPIRGVSFVVPGDTSSMLGLASSKGERSNPRIETLDFAAHVVGHDIYAYESGSSIKCVGRVNAGDSVTVALNEQNNIEYAVNGQVRHTSVRVPKFPLYLKVVAVRPGPCAQEVQWMLHDTDMTDAAATESEDCNIHKLALDAIMEEKVKLEILLAQEKSENKVLRQKLGLVNKA